MAVVVDQTIPFPAESLDLQNPHRWNDLYPLIRPSVKQVQTAKGQQILVDQALAQSKYVNIAAVGSLGNFSSKLLDEKNVTAIVTDKTGAGVLTIPDIKHALHAAGAAEGQGLVVVRSGKSRNVQVHGSDVVEVEAVGELELDHLLHLLGNATEACKISFHQVIELVKVFTKDASTVFSTFATEKDGGKPALANADGKSSSYESVKATVEKELGNVLKTQGSRNGQVTYSIHYSDINGLSRLENYILAKEIADYSRKLNQYPTFLNVINTLTILTRLPKHSLPPLPLHNPKPHRARPRPRHLRLPRANSRPITATQAPSRHPNERHHKRHLALQNPLPLHRPNQIRRRPSPPPHPSRLRRRHQRRTHHHRVRHHRRRRRLRLHSPRRRQASPSFH